MSDIVKTIREAVEGRITTLLPTWSILDHKFDLTKNHFNNNTQRFGVIALEGPPGLSILKNYTVDRLFQLTFVQGYESIQQDDQDTQDAIDVLEDAIDDVLVDLITSKGGDPVNVLNITLSGIDEPDFSIEHVTFINVAITITYKRLLS